MTLRKLNWVQIWLITGLFMILIQVFIGGVTRLTGSGLSITKWEIITGSIPPLHEKDWLSEFELYKATPQYHKINKGMTLDEFKFIYFWEYFHRLWARIMGFVFLIPLIYFVSKGMISKILGLRLVKVFVLAALVASLGWIMVASGLIDRPWVSAYKLSFHLCLALVLFLYLLGVIVKELDIKYGSEFVSVHIRNYRILFILLFVQIFFGGMMSGMKAALVYPTWPLIGYSWIPDTVLNPDNWTAYNFSHYDKSIFLPALVHLIHRSLAYIIFFLTLFYFYKSYSQTKWLYLKYVMGVNLTLTFCQVLFGILILMNSHGIIPLWYGVFHQIFGFILIGSCFFINILYKKSLQEC